jgi:DNA-binding NarL/FixJ family response regulator
MWAGHDPPYIADGLLGVLASLLRLTSVYARFDDPSDGAAAELWRPRTPQPPWELAQALLTTPSLNRTAVTSSFTPSDGGDVVRVTIMYPTLPGENGIVLAASVRKDFPTDLETFLLRVAVGQATISIQAARLLAQERLARIAAETALRERNDFLAALSHHLEGSLTSISEVVRQARGYTTDSAQPIPEASVIAPVTRRGTVRLVDPAIRLTRREAEILGLLAEGLSNKEIGAELWLSDRTIERHITGLYRKIGAQRRTEATAFALRHGIHALEPLDA